MFRAIVLVILLSISLVRAGILTAREILELESSSSSFNRPSANKNALAHTKNVFGKDARTPMESTGYPWSAIGKLSTGCTGALIGPDLVLTAAHCVIDPSTHSMYASAIYFYANMINGAQNNRAWLSRAWWGTNQPDRYRESDWALLRLDKKLGDPQGWFATRNVAIDTMKNTYDTLVGYSVDFRDGKTAGVHRNCKITKQYRTNMFLHDCHMTRGASGGPIFAYWDNQPTIYALNVADFRNDGDRSLNLPHYTDQNANIAIWSSELQKKIIELRAS